MITEDRVPFEIAKLLIDKGFPQNAFEIDCNVCYKYNGNLCNNAKSMSGVDREISYMAPTIQMVLKWLREVHKIFINVSNEVSLTDDDITYQFFVCTKEKSILHRGEDIKTFEDACNEAMKFALENLI